MNYGFILQVENMLFMRYHVDPFTMEKSMSMLDFRGFYDLLEKKVVEENKQMNEAGGGNKLMKSLSAIRDILNFMFMGKNH